MKYEDVITMMNADMMAATSHALTSKAAYSLTKFKSELERLIRDWQEKDKALVKEAEIDDAEAFDNRMRELTAKVKEGKLSNPDAKELDAMNAKVKRLMELRGELNNDDVTVSCKPMSYDEWHLLKEENKNLKLGDYELLALTETVLENILWKAPEE